MAPVRDFVDLHCHWIAAIDDGARTPEAGIAILRGLYAAGFSTVVATPHMRPGMFDNDRPALEEAFRVMGPHLEAASGLPEVHLSSEHWLDDVVFERLRRGEGLPYPGGRAVLLELPPQAFPMNLEARFVDLKRRGLRVVLAHPERYQPVWKDDACLDPLLGAGAHLLLDVCSLVGKYGRAAQKAAEKLLAEEAYEAACSDAHRPEDCETVARAIERLEALTGKDEACRLLAVAPRAILGAASHE
jgi:protein-tyrosine phosphatase